ncbi:hypothetical protein CEXT_550361 [Caerostris extrusa]|uniref:Uncharacterized protein n=1 Tax=Caerostris extrusa TaxID=172846 RepID=A0AAV4N3K2_CAEEX|nr:hypothetical protein CEXT_550361 [Caerostris extrusa]
MRKFTFRFTGRLQHCDFQLHQRSLAVRFLLLTKSGRDGRLVAGIFQWGFRANCLQSDDGFVNIKANVSSCDVMGISIFYDRVNIDDDLIICA